MTSSRCYRDRFGLDPVGRRITIEPDGIVELSAQVSRPPDRQRPDQARDW